MRAYQASIAKQAILKNTLVCLPTGLGKTLIAAVVMYNYHRWFPGGQIIFMAPTRPLVAQQVEACHKVVGLPERDTAEINGNVAAARRRELWCSRRVFYCTPQTVANDLESGALDASRIVLVVVDEAHRALKKYAYCAVVRLVAQRQGHFRVLALSATPGSDLNGVQAVIDNLRIAHVEVRTEADAEVSPHTHARLVEKLQCATPAGAPTGPLRGTHTKVDARHAPCRCDPDPGEHANLRAALQRVADGCLSRLASARLLPTTDLSRLSAFAIFNLQPHPGLYLDKLLAHRLVGVSDVLRTYGAREALDRLRSFVPQPRGHKGGGQCASGDSTLDTMFRKIAEGDRHEAAPTPSEFRISGEIYLNFQVQAPRLAPRGERRVP